MPSIHNFISKLLLITETWDKLYSALLKNQSINLKKMYYDMGVVKTNVYLNFITYILQ